MASYIVPFLDHEIGYRVLRKLIEYRSRGLIEIPVVVTTESNSKGWWPSIQELCASERLKVVIYTENFDKTDCIKHVDWFLLISWKHVMDSNLFNAPKIGTVNLHYSLLPDYRGVYPVNWAIINGEKKTGITYHFVNDRIDDGEIIMQVDAPIYLSDTARSLQLRLDDTVFDSFDDFLGKILCFKKDRKEKGIKKSSKSEGRYFSRKDFESICHLDLDKSYTGLEFINLLRGLSFFSDSNNAYSYDKESGEKVYFQIKARKIDR